MTKPMTIAQLNKLIDRTSKRLLDAAHRRDALVSLREAERTLPDNKYRLRRIQDATAAHEESVKHLAWAVEALTVWIELVTTREQSPADEDNDDD